MRLSGSPYRMPSTCSSIINYQVTEFTTANTPEEWKKTIAYYIDFSVCAFSKFLLEM